MRTQTALCAALTFWVTALAGIAPPASAQDEQQTMAVWKQREVDFFYRSSTSIYSCGALQARVASVLRAVGARDDVRVQAYDCDEVMIQPNSRLDPWETRNDVLADRRYPTREQYVRVRIQFASPTEATPEVVADIEKNKTKRELIARVTNNPAAAFEGAVQFPAEWQEVVLSNKTIGIEAEECELLEQMSQTVLRKLDLRIKRRSFTCSPNQRSRIPPKMTVEALVARAPSIRVPVLEPAEPPTESSSQPSGDDPQSSGSPPSTTPDPPVAAEPVE